MAYKVIILYQLYMPSYFLGTFTEYPYTTVANLIEIFLLTINNIKFNYKISDSLKMIYTT